MKSFFKKTFLFFCLGMFARCSTVPPATGAGITSETIYLADPAIFSDGGQYYLYGTGGGNSGGGFQAYISPDLKSWKLSANAEGYVLKRGEAYGTKGFWAPQVFTHNNTFYMAYVANENIAIAQSKTPAGPFTQVKKDSLAAPVRQIDPFVFIDDDGKKYLYHVRLTGGNKIVVAEMADDFSAIKPETTRECITATQPWENTANAQWPVTEGPSVLKHKGLYYLVYTANDFRNPDYAVGYATSNSPLGPWKKYEGNPILTRGQIGQNGPGHGDFFRKGSDLLYVFHTHHSAEKVSPRKTALVKARFVKGPNGIDRLELVADSFRFLYH